MEIRMSSWLIGVVALIYLWVAVDLFLKGSHGLALAFLAYALANVGLIMETLK